MLQSLYISKTGMDSAQFKLDVVTNNIANVGTVGFKKSVAIFQDLIYQTIREPGAQSSEETQLPTGLSVGTGSVPQATSRIHTAGPVQVTSNALDLRINGQGYFQITLPDGTIGYTKNGQFSRDSTGRIVNAQGYPLSDDITIPEDAAGNLTVGENGVVTVRIAGQNAPQELGQITTANFINEAGLVALGGNIYVESPASGPPIAGNPLEDGRGGIIQGQLEASNVNIAGELVEMIQAQRAFEINSRGITTSDQMLQRLTQI